MASGRVNALSLNVRDQPNGTVVAILTGGATVTTIGTDATDAWLLVSAQIDGATCVGWVQAQFIDAAVDDPGPQASRTSGSAIFDGSNWQNYCDVLGKRESSNDYRSVNSLGFCGRWQFGAAALVDAGYVRRGSRNSDLRSAGAWLGLNGVFARDDWLSSTRAQDDAMLTYTRAHYQSLLKLGGLRPGSSVARCAGLLAAAHLMGVGGAMSLVHGTTKADANGTTTVQYYRLLSRAFGGSGVLEA